MGPSLEHRAVQVLLEPGVVGEDREEIHLVGLRRGKRGGAHVRRVDGVHQDERLLLFDLLGQKSAG